MVERVARLEHALQQTRRELRRVLTVTPGTVVHGGTVVQGNVEQHNHINHGTVTMERHEHKHVHLALNVWGGEADDHITKASMRTLVAATTARLGAENPERLARAVLAEVARSLWQKRPANHVAYMPNVKANRARVLTAEGWEERSAEEVVDAMHVKVLNLTSARQPMETMADVRLMDPVLKNMDDARPPRAELSSVLVNMRPAAGEPMRIGAAAGAPRTNAAEKDTP